MHRHLKIKPDYKDAQRLLKEIEPKISKESLVNEKKVVIPRN